MEELLSLLSYYIPLGIIGIWRWSVWGCKKVIALHYKPIKETEGFNPSVSVMTPVYNEDPKIFREALESWARNDVQEIIAVIDSADVKCIEEFKNFQNSYPKGKYIITPIPGKREALRTGIEASSSEIVALVDCDTIWGENIRKKIVAPFIDPQVGGVGTRQDVVKENTLSRRLFAIHLNYRYSVDISFLSVMTSIVNCLSGRTALYRREAVLPLLNDLTNEKFLGRKCISGDDKCLTYLVASKKWKLKYQGSAVVYTPGNPKIIPFLKQSVRWARNSWRSDIKAILSPWAWKQKWFILFLLDKFVQICTMWFAPVYLVQSIVRGDWQITLILLAWWHVSRAIKISSHLTRHWSDVLILPLYIFGNYVEGVVKIVGLVTLNHQGWLTRWDKDRIKKVKKDMQAKESKTLKTLVKMIAGAGVLVIIGIMFMKMYSIEKITVDSSEDVAALGYSNQRKIIEDDKGNIYVAYRKKVSKNYQIFIAKITKEQEKILIKGTEAPIAKIEGGNNQRVPAIARSNDGVIHVVWYGADADHPENERQIKYASSKDGSAWGEWKNISMVDGYKEGEMWQEHPSIAAGSDGILYVTWEGRDDEYEKSQIKFSKSEDGGVTWSKWQNVKPNNNVWFSRPVALVDASNNIHIVTYQTIGNNLVEIAGTYSKDGGVTWSEWQNVSQLGTDSRYVSAAAGNDGTVYAVWRSLVEKNGKKLTEIYYNSWENGSWKGKAEPFASSSEKYQLFPVVSVNNAGNVVVSWMETPNDPGLPQEKPKESTMYYGTLGKAPRLKTKKIGKGLYPSLPISNPSMYMYEKEQKGHWELILAKEKNKN